VDVFFGIGLALGFDLSGLFRKGRDELIAFASRFVFDVFSDKVVNQNRAQDEGCTVECFHEAIATALLDGHRSDFVGDPFAGFAFETIEKKSGTCRDYTLLFIEAARSLGFGARFVTGYLYDPSLDGGDAMQGAGATHAWAEIYLPGAGWVEFDPTNALVAGENLIRIAVTRDPAQAVPIGGSFAAAEGVEVLGMEVEVTVTAEER